LRYGRGISRIMVRQNERQLNLDLLKGLAIICMVICHSVTSSQIFFILRD